MIYDAIDNNEKCELSVRSLGDGKTEIRKFILADLTLNDQLKISKNNLMIHTF